MANVQFGQGVADMSGSAAGNVFARNRGGSYTRARVKPLNPQSSRQTSVRNSMTELTTAWSSSLTQNQRDSWMALGLAFPAVGAFGASIILSGLQMYVRQNTTLLQAGLARVDDAPADLNVESLLTLTLAVDVSDGDFDVTFTPTPLDAGSRLQIFATPAMSAGISYVKNKLRLLSTYSDATGSPLEVSAEWTALFGAFPIAGQKVVIEARVINAVNGTVSSRLQAAAIVTA